MKNVLVAGAAGFLGSHLVKRHLDVEDNVWGVDDFCSSDPNSKHLKALLKNPRFSFIQADIVDDIFEANKRTIPKLDVIYNFACPASPPTYQAMPIHTMMTCVVGTGNLLQLAQQDDAIVVHASTSEVYGDPAMSPQPETYRGHVNSYGPRACYDEGKRAAESLCFDYLNTYNVDARMVRIFNTYGPHMDPHDGRVITNFVKQALLNNKLTIYGRGTQTRSFCYVDDLIDGIIKLASLPNNPKTPINLGNPIEYTMRDLATEVLDAVHGKERFSLGLHGNKMVSFEPLPVDDPVQRSPDIRLAKRVLDWEPKVGLTEGLTKMVDYMKSVL